MFTDTVGSYTLVHALDTMRSVAELVLFAYNESEEGKKAPKTGLYGSIYTVESAIAKVPLATVLFGDLIADLAVKYRHHCQEKGCRLGEHVADGHVSSFQSADMKETWPGAVFLGEDYIFSGSGLPWKHDESFTLITGLNLGLTTEDTVREIATISENELLLPPRFTKVG